MMSLFGHAEPARNASDRQVAGEHELAATPWARLRTVATTGVRGGEGFEGPATEPVAVFANKLVGCQSAS